MKKILMILTSSYLFSILLYAQWTPADLGGRSVQSLAVSGNNLFAGTFYYGNFLSTDNGTSWNSIYSNLPVSSYRGGEFISAWEEYTFTTYSDHLYRSTNYGISWSEVYYSYNNYIHSIIFSDVRFLAGCSNGILHSTDYGANWTSLNSNLTNIPVLTLALAGEALFAGTWEHGIFRSTNDGISWTEVNAGLTNYTVHALLALDSIAIAGTDSGIFRTTNNGNSWIAINNGIIENYIIVHALASIGTNIFAGTDYGGVYRSSNNGESWEAVNTGIPEYGIRAFAISDTNLFVGTNGKSVFRTANNGDIWTSVNIGIWDFQISSIAALDTTLFVSGSGGDVFRSIDRGSKWTTLYQNLEHSAYTLTEYKTNLFATTYDGLFRTTNKGESWTKADSGLEVTYFPGYGPTLAGDDSNLFAGVYGGDIFLSTNNGTSWTSLYTGLPVTTINSFAFLDHNIFAGTSNGVFLSNDNGINWSEVSNGLSYTNILSLVNSGVNLFAGTYGGGVFRSTDGGTSWVAVNNGLSRFNIKILVAFDTNLFAGTEGGVFLSTNNGENWANISTGLLYLDTRCLTLSGNYLFAGSGNPSVWKLSLSEIVVSVEKNDTEPYLYFELYQNYPNPFNPTTTINYEIPERGFVSLKVYDILGEEVATLVNEEKPAGSYDIQFEGIGLTSGIYFYQLNAGEYSETKKMILLK